MWNEEEKYVRQANCIRVVFHYTLNRYTGITRYTFNITQ